MLSLQFVTSQVTGLTNFPSDAFYYFLCFIVFILHFICR
jgi:hypothetical protein